MTVAEMKRKVEELMLEAARLARMGLELGPAARSLLSRLLYRLGYTDNRSGVSRMSRRRMARTPKVQPTYPDFIRHAGHALDNPTDDTVILSLLDHIEDTHPGDPHVAAFRQWANGEKQWGEVAQQFIGSRLKPAHAAVERATPNEPYLEIRPSSPHSDAIDRESPDTAAGFITKHENKPYWERRRPNALAMASDYPYARGQRTVPVPGSRMTGADVANHIYSREGVRGLLLNVIGARHYHPEKVAARESGAAERGVRFVRSGVKRRFARLTLGAARPRSTISGETENHHDILDESGKPVGTVKVTPRNDGRHLHVGWIGAGQGDMSNVLGAGGMRSALASLSEHYPGAEYVSGFRTSGFRTRGKDSTNEVTPGQTERTVVAIPRVRSVRHGEKPVRYAKIDGNVLAHHSIHGFPIAIAARHIANDPKATDAQRELAHHFHRTGEPETLWALNDALQEGYNGNEADHHPLAKAYNWMSAADKLHLDRHTYRALEEAAERTRQENPDSEHRRPDGSLLDRYTPERHAARASVQIGEPESEDPNSLLNRIRSRVVSLALDQTPENIDESIRRHSIRSSIMFHSGIRGPAGSATAPVHSAAKRATMPYLRPTPKSDSGSVSEHQHLNELAARYRRQHPKRYAIQNKSGFLDALARLRSSNQRALHQVAETLSHRLGLKPTRVLPALHDTPQGSVPGVALASYGNAPPERVHEAAAWLANLSNAPGFAVFHVRPGGRDTLYRMRQEGSGRDIRARLDRHGIRNRVLMPTKKGFDILVPDRENKLRGAVSGYAQEQGLHLESDTGHFALVGSPDQAQARSTFRNTIAKSEHNRPQQANSNEVSSGGGPIRSRRSFIMSPRRMGRPAKATGLTDEESWHRSLAAAPDDHTVHLAFADWLQDRGNEPTAESIRTAVREGPRENFESPESWGNSYPAQVWAHVAARFPNPSVRGLLGVEGDPDSYRMARAIIRHTPHVGLATYMSPSDRHPESSPGTRYSTTERLFHDHATNIHEGSGWVLRHFGAKVVGGRFHLFDHGNLGIFGEPNLVGSARTAGQLDSLLERAARIGRERGDAEEEY